MADTETYYLRGFTNYATERDVKKAEANVGTKYGSDKVHAVKHSDGTWTINYLSLKQVQPGQVPYVGHLRKTDA